MQTVFVILPVFQRLQITRRCIDQLLRQTYPKIKVIVSDGGSQDGSPEALLGEFPGTTVLRTSNELWWAGAAAAGISHALKLAKMDDFVLLMNDDTGFENNFIEKLVDTAKEHFGCIGSLTVDSKSPDTILDAGEFMDWEKYMFPVRTEVPEGQDYCDTVDYLPGRGTLVPIEIIQKVGNINASRFPHYISDYDFFARVKKAGFKLILSYRVKLLSDTAVTGIFDKGEPQISWSQFKKFYFSIRSMNRFIDHYRFISDQCPPEFRRKHQIGLTWLMVKRGLFSIPFFFRLKQFLKNWKAPFKRVIFSIFPPVYLSKSALVEAKVDWEKLKRHGVLREIGVPDYFSLSVTSKWKRIWRSDISILYENTHLRTTDIKTNQEIMNYLTQ